MSDVTWPAWMPEPPTMTTERWMPPVAFDRAKLLAWYAEAKQRDPTIRENRDIALLRQRLTQPLSAAELELQKRAAFPLPEDGVVPSSALEGLPQGTVPQPPKASLDPTKNFDWSQDSPLPFPEDDNA